jgi:ferritin-like protein
MRIIYKQLDHENDLGGEGTSLIYTENNDIELTYEVIYHFRPHKDFPKILAPIVDRISVERYQDYYDTFTVDDVTGVSEKELRETIKKIANGFIVKREDLLGNQVMDVRATIPSVEYDIELIDDLGGQRPNAND